MDDGACLTIIKGADGIELVVNKTAADAVRITVPEKYATVPDNGCSLMLMALLS